MKKVPILLLAFVLVISAAVAKEKKPKKEDKAATLNFLVVKETNGKPVRNASVVLHVVEGNGKQSKGGFELKTDPEGKTAFDGVPFGRLRVQVLAPGFQTFGDDYDINQRTQEIVIKLKPPQGQYSIYK
jgi:hypothetical protein